MKKKLVRHGNSWALVIDKPILELLGISGKTALQIEIDGRRLVVTPTNGQSRKDRLRKDLEWLHREHGPTLRRLAE